MKALLRPKGQEGASVHLVPANTDYTVRLEGLDLLLDPLAGSDPKLPGLDQSRAKAKANYRYFLLVNRPTVAAGQNEEVERPAALMRLLEKPAQDGAITYEAQCLKDSAKLTVGDYRGRVLEIIVNGIYLDGISRLDRYRKDGKDIEMSEREFWEQVLTSQHAGWRHDAAGMIRRVSDAFVVRVGK